MIVDLNLYLPNKGIGIGIGILVLSLEFKMVINMCKASILVVI
jgi:hypothetical protein